MYEEFIHFQAACYSILHSESVSDIIAKVNAFSQTSDSFTNFFANSKNNISYTDTPRRQFDKAKTFIGEFALYAALQRMETLEDFDIIESNLGNNLPVPKFGALHSDYAEFCSLVKHLNFAFDRHHLAPLVNKILSPLFIRYECLGEQWEFFQLTEINIKLHQALSKDQFIVRKGLAYAEKYEQKLKAALETNANKKQPTANQQVKKYQLKFN